MIKCQVLTGNPEVIPGYKSASSKRGSTEGGSCSDLLEPRLWPVTGDVIEPLQLEMSDGTAGANDIWARD